MIDVLLVYEHKVREIETLIAIKKELEKNNLKVELMCITDKYKIKYLFKRPKLVVVPSLYGNQSFKDHIGYICGNVKKILNLQWEQVYNGDSLLATRTPKDLAKEVVHICWGNESLERLKRADVKYPILIGPPQMDFLKGKFEKYYKTKEEICKEYGFSLDNQLLLFISSFAYHCVTENQLEHLSKLVDWDVYKFKNITINTRDIVLEWFKSILEKDSNKVIIYRPHPSELDDEKLNFIERKYPNFKVIRDYSVKQWIKVSDIVLNWFSTSGVEAYFSNVNCIYLRPIELEKEYDYAMYKNVLKIKEYNEFKEYIDNPKKISSYYEKNNISKDINHYYLKNSELCYEKIAKLIIEMLNSNKYDFDKKYVSIGEIIVAQFKDFVKTISDECYDRFPKFTMNTLGKSQKIYDYLRENEYRKKEHLSLEEKNDIINRIERCN